MLSLSEHAVGFPEQNVLAVRAMSQAQAQALATVPNKGTLSTQDGTLFLFPWTLETCRVLYNVGFDALPLTPFWQDEHPLVEGVYTGLPHQLITSAFITFNPRCYVLSDCRLGKTGSVILAMDYLQRQKAFQGGVLIITTVTTMRSVWASNIQSTLPNDTVAIVHGKDKKSALAGVSAWYITNYDSVRLNLPLFIDAVKGKRIGAVVVDEMTHVGNSSSQRHKAICKLINETGIQYAVGMTGSPGSNPEPVYGMAKTINPAKLPARTKMGWMDLTTYIYGPQPYMRKPKVEAQDIIKNTLSPAIRFRKESVLYMPPIVYQDRECGLSTEQKRIIEELRADAVAYIKSETVVSAPNRAALTNKLLQVSLGFIIRENEVIDLDHTDRTLTVREAIEETERKVVVFSMFKHRLKTLQEELADAALIDGDVKGEERAKILHAFQNEEHPRVLCCHPVTVGFGTELSAADTMIFDGPPVLGNFVYTQALERLSSTKQKSNKISVIKIMASTEEKYMFKRLDKGWAAGQAIAGLFEKYKKGIDE